jgi:hypothetical protein
MRLSDNQDGPYQRIVDMENQARAVRNQAAGCGADRFADVDGIPDRDGDGIVDQEDKMPDEGEESVDTRRVLGNLSLTTKPQAIANTVGGQVTTVATAAAHDTSMLIRTAEIALAVYEVEKNLSVVEANAKELGGYLALRSDREITVRVPKSNFDALVARIEKMGDVLHKNVAAEDVTDQYVDLDMRLKNALALRARLEKLLETATVRDAVEIHKELTKVTEDIERLQGKLKLSQSQQVRSQALLPFSWMSTIGLSPLLQVPR